MTFKAVILDADNCLANDIPNLTLCPSATAEQFRHSIEEVDPDIVILDLTLPEGIGGLELIAEMRQKGQNIPAILLTREEPTDQVWRAIAAQPMTNLMHTPVSPGKLQYHLARLLECRLIHQVPPPAIQIKPVPELRNDESGRLDANKIAEVFGLTMADMAVSIGRPRTTIIKTPDCTKLQVKLRDFERIAGGLLTITGSIKGLKMWLNSPAPNLDNHMPIEAIRLGKIELLAGWVDDARLGSPS